MVSGEGFRHKKLLIVYVTGIFNYFKPGGGNACPYLCLIVVIGSFVLGWNVFYLRESFELCSMEHFEEEWYS